MNEEPSFWDDYFRVLPWNALALVPLVLFFWTLQEHISIFWSLLIGFILILSLNGLKNFVRSLEMKLLLYANLVFWTGFVVVAIVSKIFGMSWLGLYF